MSHYSVIIESLHNHYWIIIESLLKRYCIFAEEKPKTHLDVKFQSKVGIPTLVEEAVFDETYRDFDPEELLSLQRFSIELEEVVFDETYRFCNDFYTELEEAVFR